MQPARMVLNAPFALLLILLGYHGLTPKTARLEVVQLACYGYAN